MRKFFDTNVLVYLFDDDNPDKKQRAVELFSATVRDGAAVLSTQVLQEFYVTVTRKLACPLPLDTAYRALQNLSVLPLVSMDEQLILSAARMSQNASFSFWDALIVQAAMKAGAGTLFSEDMQHDRVIAGLRIVNPFR